MPVFEQRPAEEVVLGADKVWLGRMTRPARRNLVEQVKATPVDDTLRSIYKTTMDEKEGEVALGWAEGPYTEEMISQIIGDDLWIAARRC